MSGSRSPLQLRGTLIAPAARAWLSDSRAQARSRRGEAPQSRSIHSRFRQSVNLVNGDGELLSLVTQDLGPGPFALVVRPESPGFIEGGGFEAHLKQDSPVGLDRERLSIGKLEAEFSGAAHWTPRPSWERVGARRIAENLAQLRRLLAQHAPAGSFAPLAGMPMSASNDQPDAVTRDPSAPIGQVAEAQQPGELPTANVQAAALAAAAPSAAALVVGLQARDPAAVGGAAQQLAGLGGGVTPSGDDYLLGAVHAMWALMEPAEAQSLGEMIVGAAAPRTNRISAAWLKAAGRGEAGNEWHVLAVALASGAPVDEPAEWLIRRGHTSGADALAGFLTAAEALLQD